MLSKMHHKALDASSMKDGRQQIITGSSSALFVNVWTKKAEFVLDVFLMSGWNRRDSGEFDGRTQNQDNICPNCQRVCTDWFGLGGWDTPLPPHRLCLCLLDWDACWDTDWDMEPLWWLNMSQNMIFMDRRVYILHQWIIQMSCDAPWGSVCLSGS